MELAYAKLDAAQIDEALRAAPGWMVLDNKLGRTFEFPTYKDGLAFALAAGNAADGLDHHPDILIGYKKVSISVNTHDVGGISPYDFELARRIDALN